jgi:hypothetical protein
MIRYSDLALRTDRLAARHVLRGVSLPLLAGLVAMLTAGHVVAAEAPRTIAPAPAAKSIPVRKTIVDPAVAPAGGGCRQCGPGGCRHGHGGHGHHSSCRDGHCVPYCPVRPGQFGFYDTRWRKWPGQGVVPASAVQSATPATPPKSSPPGVNEESFGPPAGDDAGPAADSGNPGTGLGSNPPRDPDQDPAPIQPGPLPVEPEPIVPAPQPPAVPEPDPVLEPEVKKAAEVPRVTEPEAEPAAEVPAVEPPASEPVPEPAVEKPAPEKAAPDKANDDLFDEAATDRVQRVFVAARLGEARRTTSPRVEQVVHRQAAVQPKAGARQAANPKQVPRVSFDPQAEAARLRSGQ